MGFLTWAKRLDDRLEHRLPWFDRPMPVRITSGLLLLVISGGNLLGGLLSPGAYGGGFHVGFTVLYGVGAAAGVALLLAGRRKTRHDR